MTVLVAFASKHGATEEIARSIGEVLDAQGLTVEVKRMEDVDTVLPYDAFVLGSAIYMGNWLRDARSFVDEHAEALALRPTWLFSSGPIGSPPDPTASDSFEIPDLVSTTHARGHQLFGGKLDKAELGLAERALAGALRVPAGDYRQWAVVAAWATAIARTLETEAVR
jgi:menaquinone-dependent protoporphyrinogen oxidase